MILPFRRGLWGAALLLAAALPLSAGQDFWTGNGPEGGSVERFAVDPANPGTLYVLVASRVDRSTDAGLTWTPISVGLPQVLALATDSTTPSGLYVIAFPNRVFHTANGGSTWSEVAPLPALYGWQFLAFDPSGSGTLYAAKDDQLYRSTPPVTSWARTDSGLSGSLRDIAIVPGSPSILYVATDFGVFRSGDGGLSWNATASLPASGLPIMSVAALPGSPNTVFAGLFDGPIYRSLDGGGVWTLNLTTNYQIYRFAVSAASPSTIYASFPIGIRRSLDGGDTWTLLPGPGGPEIAAAPDASNVVYQGNGRGVYRSVDSGASWAATNSGLRHTAIQRIAMDPLAPNVLIAVAGTVFRSSNGGTDWSEVATDFNVVAIAPSSHTTVYIGSYSGVSKSTDGGLTFAPTTGPSAYVNDLLIDLSDSDVVYAATGSGVFKTVDGGAIWSPSSNGLTQLQTRNLAMDPTDHQILYAAPNAGGLFRTVNGGASWTPVPFPGNFAWGMVVIPGAPSTVVVASPTVGIFRSSDHGDSWTSVDHGIPTTFVEYLLGDPSNPSTLYAGTSDGGVWKSTASGDRFAPFSAGLPATAIRSLAISADGRFLAAGTFENGVFAYTITSNSFYTVPPCRVLDTRDPIGPYGGPALSANVPRSFTLAGRCGIPSTARAVAANVAVTQPLAAGFLAAWQGQTADPGTSTLNFKLGQTRSSNATLVLGPAGDALFNLNMASGTGDLIIDVTGYYAP